MITNSGPFPTTVSVEKSSQLSYLNCYNKRMGPAKLGNESLFFPTLSGPVLVRPITPGALPFRRFGQAGKLNGPVLAWPTTLSVLPLSTFSQTGWLIGPI